jgi:hypothetical protein
MGISATRFVVLLALLMSVPSGARAASIQHNIAAGYQFDTEIGLPLPKTGGGDVPGFAGLDHPFTRSKAVCPAPDANDFLCGEAFAATDIVNGIFTLSAKATLARHNGVGQGLLEATYGDARIEMFGVTGVLLPTSGYAKFHLGLTGNVSLGSTSASLMPEALATARLSTYGDESLQCLGTTCPPIEVPFGNGDPNKWDPHSSSALVGLYLRADARLTPPVSATDFDAELVANVFDTLQLHAIEVLDDARQVVPGAYFSVQTIQGTTITFPTTPTTPSPTTTTVTTPGGSSTTSTTQPGEITARFVGGKTLSLKDDAKTTKRRGTLVLTVDAAATAGLDPTQGAEVRLRGLQTGARDTWNLPAAGWKATKKGFKYADKRQANGPVTAAVLGKGRLVVKAKGAAMAYPLLGTGPQGAIAAAIVFPGGPTALCAEFPGAGATAKKDDPAKGVFVATKAPGPTACRGL